MIFSLATELNRMEIKHYTKDRIPDVLRLERDLRTEESIWGSWTGSVSSKAIAIGVLSRPWCRPCARNWKRRALIRWSAWLRPTKMPSGSTAVCPALQSRMRGFGSICKDAQNECPQQDDMPIVIGEPHFDQSRFLNPVRSKMKGNAWSLCGFGRFLFILFVHVFFVKNGLTA